MLREYQKLGTFGDRGNRDCRRMSLVGALRRECAQAARAATLSSAAWIIRASVFIQALTASGHLSAMDNQHGEKPIAFDRRIP